MTTAEQALRKRVRLLESDVEILQTQLYLVMAMLEKCESLANAFAFDLALYEEDRQTAEHLGISWTEAQKAARGEGE